MNVLEDRETVTTITLKKRSVALRHVLRAHRIAIDWLSDCFGNQDVSLRCFNTSTQVADIFTMGCSAFFTTSMVDLVRVPDRDGPCGRIGSAPSLSECRLGFRRTNTRGLLNSDGRLPHPTQAVSSVSSGGLCGHLCDHIPPTRPGEVNFLCDIVDRQHISTRRRRLARRAS